MMNNLRNSVRLYGNVGQDPEIKIFESGKKAAKFSLATSEKYKDQKGELVEETTWHNLVALGKLVDTVEKYVNKGDKLCVEGKISNRSYEAKDGTKKYISEIVISEFLFASAPKNKSVEMVVSEENLPF